MAVSKDQRTTPDEANAVNTAPARYFVVQRGAFRMSPGLYRLGHDFGNGLSEYLFFQRDRTAAAYRREKEQVFSAHPERLRSLSDRRAQGLQARAFLWMNARFESEHGFCPIDSDSAAVDSRGGPDESDFREFSLAIQEDFALIQRDAEGKDRIVLVSVCFPSGWRPEKLLGKSFLETHSPVPEFGELSRRSRQLVTAMVERGPYVRFVWSITADSRLDHHPDHAPRDSWTQDSPGYLRVERQVTVPFPQHHGSLFLIRTYLYPFAELEPNEREVLKRAFVGLPHSVREYKGLREGYSEVLQRLTTGAAPGPPENER